MALPLAKFALLASAVVFLAQVCFNFYFLQQDLNFKFFKVAVGFKYEEDGKIGKFN